MKNPALFLFVIFTACKPYQISPVVKEIPITEFSGMYKSAGKIKNLAALPRKIRNIPEFKYQEITTDSVLFNTKNGSTSLFLSGAYDKKTRSGFIIQGFIGINKFNQCILFKVQDTLLNCNYYSLPTNINTWQDAKPF